MDRLFLGPKETLALYFSNSNDRIYFKIQPAARSKQDCGEAVSKQKQFMQGYCCAITGIVVGHGNSTEVREALAAGGITTLAKLKTCGADPYDIENLAPIVKEIEAKAARSKRWEG